MRRTLALFAIAALVLSVSPSISHTAQGASGSWFNHIIIVAMENQNYGSVIGSSSAPFINSLASLGSTINPYHSYGQNINGCSAGCYQAFDEGTQSYSDSWCPKASSPCRNAPTLASQLGSNFAGFCDNSCPRGNDHFPFGGYTDTWASCWVSNSCTGQAGTSGDLIFNPSASNGESMFQNYLNSANPASVIWFTPDDNENMHDGTVSQGDSFIKSLMVGTGTISSPAAGSVFSSSLWRAGQTMLYLWWDEYDPSPNVEYGPMVKAGYTSTSGYDEYNSLHTVEQNFGLSYLTSIVSSASPMSDLFGTGGPPPSFTASFNYAPSTPVAGQTITLTATASGGTAPYHYAWNAGGSVLSPTNPAVWSPATAGVYTVTLTASDSGSNTLQVSQPITVGSASTTCSNGATNPPACTICPAGQSMVNGQCVSPCTNGATNPPSCNQCPSGQSIVNGVCTSPVTGGTAPLITGWATGIAEATNTASGNPPSQVFQGQTASDLEYAIQTMKTMGYNGVRLDFDSTCGNTGSFPQSYSATNLQKAIQIAAFYNFWLVVDYHSYNDIFNSQTCWLSFWSGVVTQFSGSYSQLVWEPENEPAYGQSSSCSGASACMPVLTSAYQSFITQTRNLGDTHWIVIQNVCSYGCSFTASGAGDASGALNGYPTPTDSAGHLFYSMHAYLQTGNSVCGSGTNVFTVAYATCDAQGFYNTVATWKSQGHAILNTESGADEFTNLGGCGFSGPQPTSQVILCGSAGYSNTTLAFMQALATLYKANGIGSLYWTAGDWTTTPGAGPLGAIQCNSSPQGWGCLIVGGSGSGGGTGTVNIFYQPIITTIALTGIFGGIVGAVVWDRKRHSSKQ